MQRRGLNDRPKARAENGPVCSHCGHGSYPHGYDAGLGLCWMCAFPRSPEYFARMAADTAQRGAVRRRPVLVYLVTSADLALSA